VKIVFACENCQSPFMVAAELAGRTGRCRHRGQRMIVPASCAPERLAVKTRERAVAEPVGAAAGAGPNGPRRAAIAPQRQPVPSAHRGMSWREAVTSQLALKPITEDMLPAVRLPPQPKPEPKDSESDYKLKPVTKAALPAIGRREEDLEKASPGSVYKLAIPRSLRKQIAARNRSPSAVRKGYAQGVRSYRQFFSILARLSDWISNASYTVSFICLILAIAGGIIGQHSLAVFALSAIVVFNIVGMAGDVVQLVMLSFRKNPIQGALFLIPPVTVIYLLTDWRRYRETVNRMMIPVFMLCLVVVAYMFVPGLNGSKPGQKTERTLGQQLEKAVESIKTHIGDSTSKALQKAGETKDALGGGPNKEKSKAGEPGKGKTGSEAGMQKRPPPPPPQAVPAPERSNPDGAETPAKHPGA
jgi:hypothetical protein